ncbi:MAG: hypothetical protein D6790_19840 [Caldilineae bacterium]|nr:MAG: hypothetical protein D6790_19840 [Caldilineae bacterium]
MIDFKGVFIDALWVLGLAGVLATFSYHDWKRSQRGWRWRFVWQLPSFLLPLSLSLTLFCVGVGLSGATAYQPDPWWQTAIWGVMTLVFALQSALYWRAGRTAGWDAPMDAAEGDEQSPNSPTGEAGQHP